MEDILQKKIVWIQTDTGILLRDLEQVQWVHPHPLKYRIDIIWTPLLNRTTSPKKSS